MKWTRFFYDPDAIFSVRLGQIMTPVVALVVLAFAIGAAILR